MDTTAFAALAGFPRALFSWLVQAPEQAAQPADFDMLQAILPAVVDSIRCYA